MDIKKGKKSQFFGEITIKVSPPIYIYFFSFQVFAFCQKTEYYHQNQRKKLFILRSYVDLLNHHFMYFYIKYFYIFYFLYLAFSQFSMFQFLYFPELSIFSICILTIFLLYNLAFSQPCITLIWYLATCISNNYEDLSSWIGEQQCMQMDF